jgi:ankyrin repeat protein
MRSLVDFSNYFIWWGLLGIIWIFWLIVTNKKTSLHNAVINGYYQQAQWHLTRGINPDIVKNGGMTPLFYAIIYNEINTAKLLIDYGADVNWGVNNQRKDDYLLTAISLKHFDIATLLIERGAQLGIHYYSFIENKERVIEIIRSNPEMISLERNGGKTPLHYAVMGRHKDLIDILINAGADVNKSSASTGTCLHQAITDESIEMVDYLFEKCNVSDENINIGLTCAVNQGNIRIVKLLVERGANIHQFAYNTDPLLHLSVRSGNLDVTAFLLESGAKVNQRCFLSGDTPLHKAVFENNLLIADLLIHYGADVNAVSFLGSTPLGLSRSNIVYKRIENLLLQYGANNYGIDD